MHREIDPWFRNEMVRSVITCMHEDPAGRRADSSVFTQCVIVLVDPSRFTRVVNKCHTMKKKQWRATLGQRSHATQTNACKSVEHGHARACPRKCYTFSELEQPAEYNDVYMTYMYTY